MGWTIESMEVEGQQGTVRPFNFIYTLPPGRNGRPASYRGDGLLLGSGSIRLNREQVLMQTAQQHGVDPQELIEGISQQIASEASGKLEVARAV